MICPVGATLFLNLEFSRFNDAAALIAELVNV